MGLGTKNRQAQTAELCKSHLRANYPAQAALVEDFIREIEGNAESADPAKWGQFTDLSRSTEKLLNRLDEAFGKWLRGEV